jgi:hypothetical protein
VAGRTKAVHARERTHTHIHARQDGKGFISLDSLRSPLPSPQLSYPPPNSLFILLLLASCYISHMIPSFLVPLPSSHHHSFMPITLYCSVSSQSRLVHPHPARPYLLFFPRPASHFSDSCLHRPHPSCLAGSFRCRFSIPHSLLSILFFPPLPDSEAMRRSGMAEDVAEKIFEDFCHVRA